MNEILLRRKNKVMLKEGSVVKPNKQLVVTIMKNVESLGYTFSEELTNKLLTLTNEELQKFYSELIPSLQSLVGANVVYNPMYPNFPQSVMEASDAELFWNALVHYWSNGMLYPNEEKKERTPLFENTKVKVLGLGTTNDLQDIFFNLCKSKTSLSQVDRDDLAVLFKGLNLQFPEEIPLKENVALIGKLYLENYPLATAKAIQKYFKTATDVLRLIVALSDGDISLATNTRFRSFKRKERRLLLELLENCGRIEEDMVRYKNRWIRVGERLHPAEYTDKFPRAATAFSKLRNGVKIETFASKVTNAMENLELDNALALLSDRPGEFARRLDHLLRIIEYNKDSVLTAFKQVAHKVSTPVLLQVREHFTQRNAELEERVFFPKGSLARCHCEKNNLPALEERYCQEVVAICENALLENYREREPLGKVFVSEGLKKFVVPFSQRSASKMARAVVRGSRLPIDENTKAIRAFIWWTNTETQRVDIDLSSAVFDENWQFLRHISYTNLCDKEIKSYHSGDIVDGGPVDGDGVSEFLDFDIDSVVENGARYVVYQVYCYTEQSFAELPHAMFGWMNREDTGSGEIYEPRTVEQKMDLTSQGKVSIPVIFDCVAREMIWCDMCLSLNGCHSYRGGNNVESNLNGVAATCYSVTKVKKPNLYDLAVLNAEARGELVEVKEEADIVFSEDEGITPYDIDTWVSNYL